MSKRVLVVKLSSLGDLFHALPAVHALKTGMNADIDWVTQPEYAPLVECFDDVDHVITFPRRRFHAGIMAFLKRLRANRYDMVVDFQGLLKSALTARLARTAVRVGPAVCREGAGWFYSVCPPRPSRGAPRDVTVHGAYDFPGIATLQRGKAKDARLEPGVPGKRHTGTGRVYAPNRTPRERLPRDHAVEEALQSVRYLGVDIDQPVFPVSFPLVSVTDPKPRIGLVPGSRWPSKNWPAACFQQLAAALVGQFGGSLFLLGGESDRDLCRTVADGCPDDAVHNLAGEQDLVGLGSRMQTLDLVITNDTGPMHMAAALGIPVIALFGPTEARRTGPWGARCQVLRAEKQPACAPCYQRQCQRRESTCLSGISVARVLNAARQSLDSFLSLS